MCVCVSEGVEVCVRWVGSRWAQWTMFSGELAWVGRRPNALDSLAGVSALSRRFYPLTSLLLGVCVCVCVWAFVCVCVCVWVGGVLHLCPCSNSEDHTR